MYYGIKIPAQLENASWSKEFREWVKNLSWEHKTAEQMIKSNIDQVEYLHYEINETGNKLRKY